MHINILIGGKAGQGINKISEIVSNILIKRGYFVFNYRDYPSLIKGGHNFNILAISDERVGSFDSIATDLSNLPKCQLLYSRDAVNWSIICVSRYMFDGIVALDGKTVNIHKKELKEKGVGWAELKK